MTLMSVLVELRGQKLRRHILTGFSIPHLHVGASYLDAVAIELKRNSFPPAKAGERCVYAGKCPVPAQIFLGSGLHSWLCR